MRYHRGVDHAQARYAVHTQFGIDHGEFIAPHAAGAHGVIVGLGLRSDECVDLRIRRDGGARLQFFTAQRIEGFLRKHHAGDAYRGSRDAPILLAGKIVLVDQRSIQGICRGQPHTTAARGTDHVGVRGEPVVRRQFASVVGIECHHEQQLDVGLGERGIGLHEGAGFHAGIAERASAGNEVLHQRRRAMPRLEILEQRDRRKRAVLHHHGEVILQALADARQLVAHRDTVRQQLIGRTDA